MNGNIPLLNTFNVSEKNEVNKRHNSDNNKINSNNNNNYKDNNNILNNLPSTSVDRFLNAPQSSSSEENFDSVLNLSKYGSNADVFTVVPMRDTFFKMVKTEIELQKQQEQKKKFVEQEKNHVQAEERNQEPRLNGTHKLSSNQQRQSSLLDDKDLSSLLTGGRLGMGGMGILASAAHLHQHSHLALSKNNADKQNNNIGKDQSTSHSNSESSDEQLQGNNNNSGSHLVKQDRNSFAAVTADNNNNRNKDTIINKNNNNNNNNHANFNKSIFQLPPLAHQQFAVSHNNRRAAIRTSPTYYTDEEMEQKPTSLSIKGETCQTTIRDRDREHHRQDGVRLPVEELEVIDADFPYPLILTTKNNSLGESNNVLNMTASANIDDGQNGPPVAKRRRRQYLKEETDEGNYNFHQDDNTDEQNAVSVSSVGAGGNASNHDGTEGLVEIVDDSDESADLDNSMTVNMGINMAGLTGGYEGQMMQEHCRLRAQNSASLGAAAMMAGIDIMPPAQTVREVLNSKFCGFISAKLNSLDDSEAESLMNKILLLVVQTQNINNNNGQ